MDVPCLPFVFALPCFLPCAPACTMQMGIGRTTTGMVIASLVHMYTEGALATARWVLALRFFLEAWSRC